MNQYFYLAIFLVTIVFGVGLEVLLSNIYFKKSGVKNKHQVIHFKFYRYLFLVSVPIIITLIMSRMIDASILKFFIIFALLGTILEYCIGYSYKMVVGQKLWSYYRYSIKGYTSLLSIPLWGLCGSMMYLLVRAIS